MAGDCLCVCDGMVGNSLEDGLCVCDGVVGNSLEDGLEDELRDGGGAVDEVAVFVNVNTEIGRVEGLFLDVEASRIIGGTDR